MKVLSIILLCSMLNASPSYAAGDNGAAAVPAASARRGQELKKLNDAAIADKAETREELTALGAKLGNRIEDLEVDKELLKAARDKSLDWKTRFFLLERVERGGGGKISKDEELSLYSDTLLDPGEHAQLRKRAAEALMEPARTEVKAREALTRAAKDKNIPGEVLQSVMTSVGYSGIDDTDVLADLMDRKPTTANEMGINLNAVRALGNSKDPRAAGMLIKILDTSQPDSFFHATAMEEFEEMQKEAPERFEKVRPVLVPRLLKLLPNPQHPGLSRIMAARILFRINERRAIAPIITWLKPKSEGGGETADVRWAIAILAAFEAREAIPEFERSIANFSKDERWRRILVYYPDYSNGKLRFPEDVEDYKHLKECLKKLKGENYDKTICNERLLR